MSPTRQSKELNNLPAILHIAGVGQIPPLLSKLQRKQGYKSNVLSYIPALVDIYRNKIDIMYRTKTPYPFNRIEEFLHFLKISKEYDLFHFHYSTVLPYGFDLSLWNLLGKKIIMHYHGSDIRGKTERVMFKKFVDLTLVSTPDLLKYVPSATWIPNPVDLDELNYVGAKSDMDTIKVVHAPSNRTKKGTEYVIKAIKKLKKEGYKINLIILENMPHNKAIGYYKKADIVIDQLLIGWYGLVSIECMAFGKPVCVYIRDDLESYMPLNPTINTSPKNIVENLVLLIEDERLRKELGEKGRKYVEKVHDSKKITKQLLELYKSL